jgi:CrcB protein
MLKSLLIVFVGGGAGSALRYVVGRAAAYSLPASFPWGTFIVNVAGSFLAGLLMGHLAARQSNAPDTTQLLLMTGFLGGFTTFSAFSIDAIHVASRQSWPALAYVLGTVGVSIAAALLGLWLTRPH